MQSTISTVAPTTDVDGSSWVLPTILIATTSILLGAIWDISWHMTIGRDSLWSPPHLLEQLGAATAGSVCGAYVLWLTFRAPAAARARTVRFWGFHGPLGAWLCIWGAFAMIASVPFDNWWHNAYGLDVQILSPPHSVLMLGVLGIEFGALLFALAAQNRATGKQQTRYGYAYTFAVGVLIIMGGLAFYETIGYANAWHSSGFYLRTGLLFPFMLAAVARAAPVRLGATCAAASYMGVMLLSMWVLQLVPAEPKLAPIFNHVERMVPLAFPLVMVAPALAIDWLNRRLAGRNDWLIALAMGVSFVLVMLAVHWPFAEFMLSPAARNFVFAADQWPYMYRPNAWRYEFWGLGLQPLYLLFAFVLATISARVGLGWGNFTRKVMR